jgi:hypothetical protein
VRLHDRGVLEAEWRAPDQPGRPARHAYRLTRAGLDLARSLDDAAQTTPPLKEALA